MVAPFMLRRVKTDKKVIADLPEKLEKIDYVTMSRKQVVLYRRVVSELEQTLGEVDGMEAPGAGAGDDHEAEADLQPSGPVSGAAGVSGIREREASDAAGDLRNHL